MSELYKDRLDEAWNYVNWLTSRGINYDDAIYKAAEERCVDPIDLKNHINFYELEAD